MISTDNTGGARNTDPQTSHDAAAFDFQGAETKVLDAIIEAGAAGLAAWEFPDATGLALNCASARTAPLVRKGMIFASDERRTKPGGRVPQIVWKHIKYQVQPHFTFAA